MSSSHRVSQASVPTDHRDGQLEEGHFTRVNSLLSDLRYGLLTEREGAMLCILPANAFCMEGIVQVGTGAIVLSGERSV